MSCRSFQRTDRGQNKDRGFSRMSGQSAALLEFSAAGRSPDDFVQSFSGWAGAQP